MLMSNEYVNPIIVIDGADGAGKTTQIELLKDYYPNVNFTKFPVYDSIMGHMISEYLKGNLNHVFENMNYMDKARSISMLYTIDRLAWFKNHDTEEYRTKPLICDRYISSNIIHMGALIHSEGGTMDDIKQYIKELEYIEYLTYAIPTEAVTIYLDADSSQLMKNLKTTDKVLDIHETDTMLESINSIKKEIIDYKKYKVIKCTDDNGMRPIESINKDIRDIIDSYIY